MAAVEVVATMAPAAAVKAAFAVTPPRASVSTGSVASLTPRRRRVSAAAEGGLEGELEPLADRTNLPKRAEQASKAACADDQASVIGRTRGTLLLICPSVTDVHGAGGVSTRWREYVGELEKAGWCVEAWTVDSSERSTRVPRLVLPGFPNTLTDKPSVRFAVRLWRRLRHPGARPPVAAVVSTDAFNNLVVAMCCRGAAVPLVYSIHTDLGQLEGCPVRTATAMQRAMVRLADSAVTTSPSFASRLRERGVTELHKYYRPLPVSSIARRHAALSARDVAAAREEMTAGNPHRKVMMYVGRWSMEKRMHLLLKAVPADVTLCFVGDGPMGDTVEEWADHPRVVVRRGMRPRDELAALYAAADWTVSASAFETFGNVPYEAAHCGTPAILQRAQGFVDQIDEQEHRGALVDYGAPDAAEQVAAAVARTQWLLSRPEVVQAAARRQASSGTHIAREVEETIGAYKRLSTRLVRGAYLTLAIFFGMVLHWVLTAGIPFMWIEVWRGRGAVRARSGRELKERAKLLEAGA